MLPITSKQKAPELERRDFTEMRLGQTVLERHLPSAEDLPIEDLLKIREARESELEAFRISLRELASRIDVTQETNDLELQVRDLVASDYLHNIAVYCIIVLQGLNFILGGHDNGTGYRCKTQ
jgi:hypothetical protein